MTPFLRIPPFPGHKAAALQMAKTSHTDEDVVALLPLICAYRIGGHFWGSQPDVSASTIFACPWDRESAIEMSAMAMAIGKEAVFWPADDKILAMLETEAMPVVPVSCDPWHLLQNAALIIAKPDDERLFIARLLGISVKTLDSIPLQPLEKFAADRLVNACSYRDPFTGDVITCAEAVRLLGYWRKLIDSNRRIAAATGMAFWKRETVDPLLWDGNSKTRHITTLDALSSLAPGSAIAVWKSRTPSDLLEAIEASDFDVHEVEDGFIRSIGLGADCVPPLSITIDPLGVHFDPARESALEISIQGQDHTADDLLRARRIRSIIVEAGLSKYGMEKSGISRPGGSGQRHILVPGQVEDDRSVIAARGCVRGNLDLLQRARAAEPDSYIIYRPHPDVTAGHRVGAIANDTALDYADCIDAHTSISALLDMVDGVHVLCSLTGFEALLRDKEVTTHGVPFYAGWGLTRDLGEIPERRQARPTLDALVSAVLLEYPRYLDPLTGLPCPAEVFVHRLSMGAKRKNRLIVPLRRLQGKLRRWRNEASSFAGI